MILTAQTNQDVHPPDCRRTIFHYRAARRNRTCRETEPSRLRIGRQIELNCVSPPFLQQQQQQQRTAKYRPRQYT